PLVAAIVRTSVWPPWSDSADARPRFAAGLPANPQPAPSSRFPKLPLDVALARFESTPSPRLRANSAPVADQSPPIETPPGVAPDVFAAMVACEMVTLASVPGELTAPAVPAWLAKSVASPRNSWPL